MSEDEDSYCRLCAEPTQKSKLITTEDDVGLNSKIAAKMQWINIDISTTNSLPNGICFACFDALERTWLFLHNVRLAQVKLNEILVKKTNYDSDDLKDELDLDTCKPVDKDWDEFTRAKSDIKEEPSDCEAVSCDPNNSKTVNVETEKVLDIITTVKVENAEYDTTEIHSDGANSSDSDLPLIMPMKKKKLKTKKSLKTVDKTDDPNLTWSEYMCHCSTCNALCKNMESLRLHSLHIHSHCCIFKCSECGITLPNFKKFITHVRLHEKVLRSCCEHCSLQFKSPKHLKEHIKVEHKNFVCHNCGAPFESMELLQDHYSIYDKINRRRAKEKNPGLKCEYCQKAFKSVSNLSQHKLVHTERQKEFSCHICGKMFFTKGSLFSHLYIHEETRKFKCEYCPMAFRARGNLKSHLTLHTAVKPFVCEQCGRSFRVKRHLKSHSIMHTDLMPYVCEYCNKRFRFKTRLNLHLRQHTGVKPYSCAVCHREFTNGSNYKKHMIRRHNIDTSSRNTHKIIVDEAAGQT